MRALLSVYDKTGLIEFAKGLEAAGVELIASGGTAKVLSDADIAHSEVAEVTGAPEMLGGRVKTLHPRIHGGILADRSKEDHLADLAAQSIEPIDIVVCNLYPFRADPSIEMIDIGGPTMVRAAAKNHDHVAVVVDPADYGVVLEEVKLEGHVSHATRERLARAAFAHTAAYDAAIVGWFDSRSGQAELPPTIHLALERAGELRYGENPHQKAARYRHIGAPRGFWEDAVQHGGRELSYLNLFDAEAAWRLCHEMLALGQARHAAVIVKHANACGAALSNELIDAYQVAFSSDPVSAFGGVIALSGTVDLALAEALVANPLADVLIAPAITTEASELFAKKRKNMRAISAEAPAPETLNFRPIAGGLLVQDADRFVARREDWKVVTKRRPSDSEWDDIELAWLVCARTGSNAIVLAKNRQVVGVGAGQQNRRDSSRIATEKAAGRALGGAGASDAFFPFRDGLEALVESGVTSVIQPGGSLRDEEVIAAADELGIAMILTGERHFRH
jgi:phosphoribosylaminoimidazolecarboxamide formyltransferase/IMP cyclohydrolase